MVSQYERGIPTDDRLMQSALCRFRGNMDLAKAHVAKVKNLERHYGRETAGLDKVLQRAGTEHANMTIKRRAKQ